MSGVGGLLELYWNFIGVDRNFIGTVSLRYCYVIATLLGVDRAYIAGARSTERPPLALTLSVGAFIIVMTKY